MKKRKCWLVLVLCCVLILTLSACGGKTTEQSQSPGNGDDAKGQQYITFASGSVGGAYYSLGGAIADTITTIPGIQCVSESTGASIENARLVASGESQLGFMMSDAAYKAVEGIEPFDEKLDLKALFTMYPAPQHIITLKGSGIKSVPDMKGKKVSVDAPGSGCEAMSKEIFKAFGMTYDDINVAFLSQPEAATALKDGTIDALFWNFAYPGAVVMDVASARDIEMIPLPDDIMEKLADEFPYYNKGMIPAGVYEGVDHDTPALVVGNVIVVSSDMDDDLAYEITKILFDNIKEMAEVHPAANQMDPQTAWQTSIELHPGAEKYFKEIGAIN